MKKNLFIMFVVLFATGMRAQDTVFLDSIPDDRYFVYETWLNHVDTVGCLYQAIGGDCPDLAFAKFNNYEGADSLTVYGIAVSLVPKIFFRSDLYGQLDTVPVEELSKVIEYARIYECDTTHPAGYPYQIGPDLPFSLATTPSYYFCMNKTVGGAFPTPPIVPVYEMYFDNPITVADSFFVGVTLQSHYYNEERFKMCVVNYVPMDFMSGFHSAVHFCNGWRVLSNIYPAEELFIYPIIVPNPDDTTGTENPIDTTGNGGGDSLRVQGADMLEHMVSVSPNPAKEEVWVSSESGLQSIEAYDNDGRCILRQEANGLEARIDVRGWAAGSYLLRVATPLGATTKKLLVR